jgi:hypothetical protein
MSCNKIWNFEFLQTFFKLNWIYGEYATHLKDVFFEREQSLLPLAVAEIERRRLEEENQVRRRRMTHLLRNIENWNNTIDYHTNNVQRIEKQIKALTEEFTLNFQPYIQSSIAYLIQRKRSSEMEILNYQNDLKLVLEERDKLVQIDQSLSELTAHKAQTYTRRCIVQDCKGYLNNQWRCGICRTHVCRHCREVVPEGYKVVNDHEVQEKSQEDEKNTEPDRPADWAKPGGTLSRSEKSQEEKKEEKDHEVQSQEKIHRCNPDSIATAKLLDKDTKPCPSCKTPIYKIDGCDQMYCLQCNTAFSWKTLEIEKGRIHNPHYYEMMRKRSANGEIPREAGDAPPAQVQGGCLAEIENNDLNGMLKRLEPGVCTSLRRFKKNLSHNVPDEYVCVDRFFGDVIRIRNHILGVLIPRYRPVDIIQHTMDLRIQYVKNEIDKKKWQINMLKMWKRNEYNTQIHYLLEATLTTIRDILADMFQKTRNNANLFPLEFNSYKNQITNLINYFNEHSEKIHNSYKYSKTNYLFWSLVETKNYVISSLDEGPRPGLEVLDWNFRAEKTILRRLQTQKTVGSHKNWMRECLNKIKRIGDSKHASFDHELDFEQRFWKTKLRINMINK